MANVAVLTLKTATFAEICYTGHVCEYSLLWTKNIEKYMSTPDYSLLWLIWSVTNILKGAGSMHARKNAPKMPAKLRTIFESISHKWHQQVNWLKIAYVIQKDVG